jgi:hypothetical protein
MKEFVMARSDNTWGERATHRLIEIYLNPSGDTWGGSALGAATDKSRSTEELNNEVDLMSLLTADKLINVITY